MPDVLLVRAGRGTNCGHYMVVLSLKFVGF